MATNDPFANQNWAQQPPPPPHQGMSSGTRVLLIVLLIFGGLGLLCCGGVVGTFVYFGRQIAQATSEDPHVIRDMTQQITQISIPELLKPMMSFNMKIPFVGPMKMVVYGDKGSQSILTLGSFGMEASEEQRQQMEMQMEQALRQQGMRRTDKRPGNWESQGYQKKTQIRGQEVTFQFTKLKDPQSNETRIDVTGAIPSDQGSVMLSLSANTKVVSEQQAVKMLESIK